MGLCSFGRSSGMSSLLGWKICIYICSYGSKRDGLLICFRSVTDVSIFVSVIKYV